MKKLGLKETALLSTLALTPGLIRCQPAPETQNHGQILLQTTRDTISHHLQTCCLTKRTIASTQKTLSTIDPKSSPEICEALLTPNRSSRTNLKHNKLLRKHRLRRSSSQQHFLRKTQPPYYSSSP